MDQARSVTMDQAAVTFSATIDLYYRFTGHSQEQLQLTNRKRAVPNEQKEAGGKKRHEEENEQQLIEELCEWVIQQSLEDIEENCRLLRGLKKCSKKKLWKIIDKCGTMDQKFRETNNKVKNDPQFRQQYIIDVREFIQTELNLDLNLNDDSVRNRELADAFFYLIKEGYDFILRTILIIIRSPTSYHREFRLMDETDRYQKLSEALRHESIRGQYFYRFGNDPLVVEYHINKLLDQVTMRYYISELMEFLPLERERHFYETIKYNRGLTMPFTFCDWTNEEFDRYCLQNGMEHVLKKFSLQDSQGKTVLHTNPLDTIGRLCNCYSPKYQHRILDLLKITDVNNKTALELTKNHFNQSIIKEFTECITRNHYPIRGKPAVLIVANTSNRKGEAHFIHGAFINCSYVRTLEFEATKDRLMDLINTTAETRDEYGCLPSALIVIVTSHGSKEAVEDCDGNEIKLKDIEKVMCEIEMLREKPKILIAQCCPNDSSQPVNEKAYSSTQPHFCAITSSVSTQNSTRNNFLRELAKAIKLDRKAKQNSSILKIITNVCKDMETKGPKQTPMVCSSMSAEFRLEKYVEI